MIIFTCLLICYNPRDNVEQELLKAGALDKEDIESLRSMKSLVGSSTNLSPSPNKRTFVGNNDNLSPSSNKKTFVGSGDNLSFVGCGNNLTPMSADKKQQSSNGMMRRPSRRTSRISPSPSESDRN